MASSTASLSIRHIFTKRHTVYGLAALVCGFALLNGVLFVAFRTRTYPATYIGDHTLGSVDQAQLTGRMKQLKLLPGSVQLTSADKSKTIPTADLGIEVDYTALRDTAMRQRSWLPIANFFRKQQTALSLKYNDQAVQTVLQQQLAGFQKPATNARIVRDGASFSVKADANGLTTNTAATKNKVLQALAHGKNTVSVATDQLAATVSGESLKAVVAKLNQQIGTSINLQYNGQSHALTAGDIASLFDINSPSPALSDSAILTAINVVGSSYGIVVDNQPAAVGAIKAALQNHSSLTYTLVAAPKPSKTIRYCTAVRGVSESELPGLETKLQATYNDSRGWGLGGLVHFEKTATNCDLTVWLSSADQMPSFGAICDSLWSCTVHPYVIINFDRWRNASDAWNAAYNSEAGNRLDDYRAMVINHETGHWFGFNHVFCSAAGQLAPVMQQQSINLQGCSFNPWPLSSEQTALKTTLGL